MLMQEHVHINYHIVWCVKYQKKCLHLKLVKYLKYLKGISGNALLKEFLQIRKSLWNNQLWNGLYFCETVGSKNILKYTQRKNYQL